MMRRRSNISLDKKVLLYEVMLQHVCTYIIQFCGYASNADINIILAISVNSTLLYSKYMPDCMFQIRLYVSYILYKKCEFQNTKL